MTIDAALRAARTRLAATSDTCDLDARWLLQTTLGVDTAYVFAHGELELEPASQARFHALVERRAVGEPVAYLTGRAGFWSLDLAIDARVLVPRPDTETLVETALARLNDGPHSIADLGTGSGAIALALAHERPRWQLYATDSDPRALACARANAAALGLDNIAFATGCWLAALGRQRFDAIVSNPPYVAAGDAHLNAPELAFEPPHALIAQRNGLAHLTHIARAAPAYLEPGGWLMLEHGAEQGDAVRSLLADATFDALATLNDLGGRPRVTVGRIGGAGA